MNVLVRNDKLVGLRNIEIRLITKFVGIRPIVHL